MQMSWEQAVQGWDSEPREAAETLVQRYGPPDEMGDRRLTWYEREPWYHISVYRDKIPHNFPKKHSDYLEHAIHYQVPPERFNDVAMFDGSAWADRTKGVLHARCDKEGLNMLTLNLVHEIVSGTRGVDDARHVYTENAGKLAMGTLTDYTRATDVRAGHRLRRRPGRTRCPDVTDRPPEFARVFRRGRAGCR